MVLGNDKDILETLNSSTHAFVCFRPAEDVFIILSYNVPYIELAKHSSKVAAVVAGTVEYRRYKSGISDDAYIAHGFWMNSPTGDVPTFASPLSMPVQASVNNGELAFSFSFENRSHNKTLYSIQLRRSTLRFNEQYRWDEDIKEPAPKGTRDTTFRNIQDGADYNGYCAQVKQ